MKKITLFTLLTLLLCTSCVTKKKFMLAEMAATASKDSLQGLLNNSREVGNQLSAQVKNLLREAGFSRPQPLCDGAERRALPDHAVL